MRKNKTVALANFSESLAVNFIYKNKKYDSEDLEYKKLLKIVNKIIQEELTERQRECLLLYYLEEKKLVEISRMLKIHISAVQRHVKKAKKRIEKIVSYIFPRFTDKN